jgi:LuxR family maltose regulon positive regulatory protein
MDDSFLSSKFYIPRRRENGLERPHLTEKILSVVQHPGQHVLISGPAGFGKTTLLGEFAARYSQPVAWYSLDESDNDPGRFWAYLVEACQKVKEGFGESARSMLSMHQSLPPETIPMLLSKDLLTLDGKLVLVLDDLHLVDNDEIQQSLLYLVSNLPEKFHLIVSTRIDPPWPLARLRANNRLVEIRAAELRFTSEESAAFLKTIMQLDLSDKDMAVIETRTEGWAAGLQLAALSIQGRSDISAFIQSFSGSHLYVAEYLLEEVFTNQPEDVQLFLLQTSMLEKLTAELCEAVTGCDDGQSTLLGLYRANLFVLPQDDDARWFRYHRLFADLLKTRLQQKLSPGVVSVLHERAAEWYEQAGMHAEAINHFLSAPNYPEAIKIIEKVALPMILRAYLKTVGDWLEAIPPEYLHDNQRVNMASVWMHLTRRDFARAAPYLDRLRNIFSSLDLREVEPSIQGEWLALQSLTLSAQGNAEESCTLAEQALEILPQAETQVRTMTYMSLADAYTQMLDYERAARACEMIIQQARMAGDIASELFGQSYLGRMLLQQGKLHATAEIASKALQHLEQTGAFSPFSATLYGELAQVYYEWHKLEEARSYYLRSVEMSTLGGFSDAAIYHHVFLSQVSLMEGDLQCALEEIDKALDQMRTAAPALVREEVIAQQVRVYLAEGRITEPQLALKVYGFAFEGSFTFPDLAARDNVPYEVGVMYNCALRILLNRAEDRHDPGELNQGIELADLVIEKSLRCRHLPIALTACMLRSRLKVAVGDEQASLADIVYAIKLAQPENFISIFLEEGKPVQNTLESLLQSSILDNSQREYVREILAVSPQEPAGETAAKPGHEALLNRKAPGDEILPLVDPLTERELEVLQLIAAGDSNRTIAEKLFITVSAVKKHNGNIYGKLNVSSRTQAVARAQELGLLHRCE